MTTLIGIRHEITFPKVNELVTLLEGSATKLASLPAIADPLDRKLRNDSTLDRKRHIAA